MDLRQIHSFLAIVETGGFTQAARRLFLSQPSLSQQILNLEQELGQKLFHRQARRVSLTAAGERFLEHAQRLRVDADAAVRSMREEPGAPPAGRVRVGAIPTIGPYLMPQLMDRCRTLLTEVTIETLEDFAPGVVEELLDGNLDFALLARTLPDPRLEFQPLYDEPLLLVLPSGHPLASAAAIKPADLQNEALILLGEKTSLTAQVRRFLGDTAIQPTVRHRCSQIETVKALVQAGQGLSILPQSVREARADTRRRLVYRTLAGVGATRTVSIAWHRARYRSAAACSVERTLKEMLDPSSDP